MSKLTVKKVQSLNQPGKYGDGRNLWLIVGPTGRKRWEFRYSVGGRSREMGLGTLEFMSLDEARDRAFELRKMVKQGMDPLSAKSEKKPRATTFEQVAEQCIASQKAGWSNPKSEAQWRSSLKSYAYPTLGTMNVAAITTSDVFDVLEPIWSAKPETAKRVRERMEKVLDFATALKLRTGDNPARWRGALEPLFPKKVKVAKVRHHPALPYTEMADFMTALRAKDGVAPRALEFAILTAARTNEVLGATWSEIDMDKAVWIIPAQRMKARRDHRVPLSEAALDLLRSLPSDTEGDYVFVSPMARGKPMSNMAMLKTLKLMKRPDLTVHGFRSTFRDWAAETTVYPDTVVEMALAHAVGNAVEAAYRRGDLFEKRTRLMADWSSYCAGDSRTGAKVVPIRA
jgi:integrase